MNQSSQKSTWTNLLLAAALLAILGALNACTAKDETATGEPYMPGASGDLENVPLAATVNGRPITLQAYERELTRRQAGYEALDREPATEEPLEVTALDVLIEYELIRQEAERQGVVVTAEQIEIEVAKTAEVSGSQEDFEVWLAANILTLDEYRELTQIDLLTDILEQPVLEAVPTVAEQVHARHILVDSEEEAKSILEQLSSGDDFSQLAADFSRDATTRYNGGDLDWFPRGALLAEEVEEAAFALEAGQISQVVPSWLGYHIVQTLEYDPERPISEKTQAFLRAQAVEEWRASLWEGAEIERFVEPS